VKRGANDHWKMRELARLLSIPAKYAITCPNGLVARLVETAAQYAPAGDIGKLPDSAIARACGWPEAEAARLVEAFVQSRWVDVHDKCRLVIHDWPAHCEDAVHSKLARSHQYFATGVAPKLTGLRKSEVESARTYYESDPLATPLQPVAKGCEVVANPSSTNSPAFTLPSPALPSHTHTAPFRPPRKTAADLDGPTSDRFEDFWTNYPLQVERDDAARQFLSVVTTANEEAVFSCLARYVASAQVARGVISKPANWLRQQHRDRWVGNWPALGSTDTRSAKQREEDDEWEERGRE
jgi:hypothetical protein